MGFEKPQLSDEAKKIMESKEASIRERFSSLGDEEKEFVKKRARLMKNGDEEGIHAHDEFLKSEDIQPKKGVELINISVDLANGDFNLEDAKEVEPEIVEVSVVEKVNEQELK